MRNETVDRSRRRSDSTFKSVETRGSSKAVLISANSGTDIKLNWSTVMDYDTIHSLSSIP